MVRRRLAVFASSLGLLAGAAGLVAPGAVAKSAKCFATPVPGHPGTYIVTCTTIRP